MTPKAHEIISIIKDLRNDEQRKVLERFFKTGKGQYGEGDRFLGLKVPQTRLVVKELRGRVSFDDISELLASEWHEVRLCGFLLLEEEMKSALPARGWDTKEKAGRRAAIARFYLENARRANNWDLVDLSCEYILGPYLRMQESFDYSILLRLADSDNLWEQRIAVVTTFDFIRNGIFAPTLELVDKLCDHPHDLMHKAMGWMLREIGKRDRETLVNYLDVNLNRLPRTTLRYAIERFPEPERQYWLKRK